MNGILLINKEKNMTSRDVVNILMKIFKTKKIGHFGTLDPLATGLLVIGVGAYTKAQKIIPDEDKKYEVEVLIGMKTDTYDITGKIVDKKIIRIDEEEIKRTLLSFEKTYMQEVPIYSAVKVKGKKLYEYARNNEKVILPKKEVTIKKIENIIIKKNNEEYYLIFKCEVSKGTYIRSLINDLSHELNIPMCMSNLKRIKSGIFQIENAYTLNQIKEGNYKLIEAQDIPGLEIEEIPLELEKQIMNGAIIDKKINNNILYQKNKKNIVVYGPYQEKMKPLLTLQK